MVSIADCKYRNPSIYSGGIKRHRETMDLLLNTPIKHDT